MRQKLVIIGFSFIVLTFGSILIQSCEALFSYDGTICTVEFMGINPSYDNSPDKFSEQIGLYIKGYSNSKICYSPSDFGLISTCKATTKCARWKNDFLTTSFQMLLDKPIIVSDDTIKENTNLFQNSIFIDEITIKRNEDDCKFVQWTITLSKDLVSKTRFEEGIYNVTFNCSTTDYKTFKNNRQVIFK